MILIRTDNIPGPCGDKEIEICEKFSKEFKEETEKKTGNKVIVVYKYKSAYGGINVELYAFEI